jgi:ferric-dicitrate binding protein FerR (iron transport regulator)
MEVDKTLIKKFLQNLCSVEEAEQVWKHLQEHPGDMDFLQTENKQDNTILNPIKKEALLLKIKEKIQIERPLRKNRLWWAGASAAAILLIGFISIWININKAPIAEDLSLEKTHTLVHINYGHEDMSLVISDGSTILLKPKSEVRYLESFGSDKRDFYLKGAARFQVARDSLRPFNVYAGGTLTTALGTEFTVSAFDTEEEVIIDLHSGKVVVQPTNSVLMPGDRIFINTATLLARLNPNHDRPVSPSKIAKSNSNSEKEKSALLSFKNEPLNSIFSQLETEFSIEIIYDPKTIKNRFFTGSFNRKLGVESEVIQAIAHLNGLHVIKTENKHYELTPLAKMPKNKTN